MLGSIAKSLNGLRDTKSAFETEAQKREASFVSGKELLENKAQEIKEIVNTVPDIKEQISQLEGNVNELVLECKVMAEILSLGFSANSEIVKSGKGKKMKVLVDGLTKAKDTEVEKDEEN